MTEAEIVAEDTRNVPVILRDAQGFTREAVLFVCERGSAWPLSWIEWPSQGTA